MDSILPLASVSTILRDGHKQRLNSLLRAKAHKFEKTANQSCVHANWSKRSFLEAHRHGYFLQEFGKEVNPDQDNYNLEQSIITEENGRTDKESEADFEFD
jgi:hypothetical protein